MFETVFKDYEEKKREQNVKLVNLRNRREKYVYIYNNWWLLREVVASAVDCCRSRSCAFWYFTLVGFLSREHIYFLDSIDTEQYVRCHLFLRGLIVTKQISFVFFFLPYFLTVCNHCLSVHKFKCYWTNTGNFCL